MYFYWQLLIILFADDRAKKYGITPLSALGKEKYISGAADFGAAARPGHCFHTRTNKFDKKCNNSNSSLSNSVHDEITR